MKILAISNFYPPHHIGGYELGCRDVVDGLRGRGHDVQVLTSTHGVGRRTDEGHVHRWLTARVSGPVGRLGRLLAVIEAEGNNQACVHLAVRLFRPDVIYVWNVSFASLSLALEAERVGLPVTYYISDLWPTKWAWDPGFAMLTNPQGPIGTAVQWLAKQMIGIRGARVPAGPPKLKSAQFTSDFIRKQVQLAGFAPEHSWVIPWAVDLAKFTPSTVRWPVTRILYTGQLIEHKGVHTALEAFVRVVKANPNAQITLTLAGSAVFAPDYEARLKKIASDAAVSDRVVFLGQVPRSDLPQLYAANDLLLFPSEWDEPFSISLVEGMAAGLAVVGTLTGGTPEILRPGENALTYTAGNAEQCAAQLSRLLADRPLYESIRREARQTAEQGFGFARMLDQVEESLAVTLAPTTIHG